MARDTTMSHQLPGEAYFSTRIVRAGYRGWTRLAENIAWAHHGTPGQVFTMWIRSPDHRRNIQDCTLHEIGIGVQYAGGRAWATQDFGSRR